MIQKEFKEFNAKHKGYMMHAPLIIGGLILANYYLVRVPWITFVGWVLVAGGVCKIIMHKYCCKKKK